MPQPNRPFLQGEGVLLASRGIAGTNVVSDLRNKPKTDKVSRGL
jgi:hypothetical protein